MLMSSARGETEGEEEEEENTRRFIDEGSWTRGVL